MLYDRPVRELLKEAVSSQEGEFDRAAIYKFFEERYPRVKKTTVSAHITSGTVNDRNRRHYADAGDLLYKTARGRFERYHPSLHGTWSAVGEPTDDVAAAHARDRPPASRRPSSQRVERIRERVEDLISGFDKYLKAFEEDVGFIGPSIYFHRRTLELLRVHNSISAAVRDKSWVEYLYAMLTSWGMHGLGRGGPKLVEFEALQESLVSLIPDIEAFAGLGMEELREDEVESVTAGVWKVMERLNAGVGETRIVVTSKTLHHLLPELVPPIDRTYTLMFFYDSTQLTRGDERAFKEMYPCFCEIAREQREAIVDRVANPRTPMDTSVTKIIDNAVIGFGRARRIA